MDEKLITTSIQLKQSYKYLGARFLSNDGQPDNFKALKDFNVAALGQDEIRDMLSEKLDDLEKDGFGYTKEGCLNAMRVFDKYFYINAFLATRIREINSKHQEDLKEKKEIQTHSPVVAEELKNIVEEINLKLPLINDHILLVFTIIVMNTDLKFEEAPREEIINPAKYPYDVDRSRLRKIDKITE